MRWCELTLREEEEAERWLGVEVWLLVEAPKLAALRLAAFDDGV